MKKNLVHRFAIITLISLISTPVFSQGLKRKMADQYFEMLDYSKAAPIYDELAAKTVKGQSSAWDAVRLAAESNHKSMNYKKAEKWYEELEKSGQMTDEDYISYIDVLRQNNKHNEALTYIEKQYQKHPDNQVLGGYVQHKNYASDLDDGNSPNKVKALPFNTGLGDYAPSYYKDGLVYASRKRNSGFVNRKFLWDNSYFSGVYYVGKTKDGKSFARHGKMLGKPFFSKPHDGPVTFSRDYKTAVITMNDPGKTEKNELVRLMLFIAKADDKGKWSKAEKFPYNSQDYSVMHPSLSADGKTLYFASDMPGGQGGFDLYKSELENGSWSQPVNLGPAINTSKNEVFPFVDEHNELFFASDGHVGLGGLDIFKSGSDRSTVENMEAPINSNNDDFGFIVNEDGNLGYFTSNRGDLTDRIYEAEIQVAEFILDVTVTYDDCNNTPVKDQKVAVLNKKTGITDSLTTNESGKVNLKLKRNTAYVVTASRKAYKLLGEGSANTTGKIKSETFTADLQLASLTIDVKGKCYDKTSSKPLSEVKVTITRKSDKKTWEATSDAQGMVEVTLERNEEYTFNYYVHGYKEGSETISTADAKCKAGLDINLPLEEIKKGDVFVINNIFYDYNQATLRKESESELNKLADFLLDNNNIKIELSSHTDSRGGDSYNKRLSQKRAQSCVDYLIKKGVNKNNIVARGYGETKLLNKCGNGVDCTEEEHQQNRRTEIKILQVN